MADISTPAGIRHDLGLSSRTSVHHTACNLCEAICGLTVTVTEGKIVDIRGDQDDPLSRGHVCPKSVALVDILDDPDRLTTPVRRVGDDWVEISWQEAIEYTGRELARVQDQHGRDSIGVYMGNPIAHSLGGALHGLSFIELLQTHNRFSAASIDQWPQHAASLLLYGHSMLLPVPDLDNTQHFLIFGANPRASNGSMMTAPDMARRLREIGERGGRVVVVDPRRTETAEVADEHVFIRPGTDVAVMLAMINVILTQRSMELPAYVADRDRLRSVVEEFTPVAASAVSGVPPETIERLALDFADAESAACYGRIGVSIQKYGTLCHWAIQTLNVITGNVGRRGGTLFSDAAVDMSKLAPAGEIGDFRSRVRGLPANLGELSVAVMAEEITTPGAGQIRAMVTMFGNPVLSTPDGRALDEAFTGLDFMVAVDFYLNETTRHADIILPPTSALERENYDVMFRAMGVRNTAKYSEAVIPKPSGAMHDWEILRGVGLSYLRHRGGSRPRSLLRRLQPASLKSELTLRLTPRALIDIALRTGRHRLSVRKLLAHPSGLDLGPLQPGVKDRLKTKDGLIHLLPEMIETPLASLAAELRVAAKPNDEFPFRLIGRRSLRNNNSWGHNSGRLVVGDPRHHLLMHPADAARQGVANGPALLRSRVGAIRVDVEQTPDIMAGTVSLPHGYGHNRPGVRLRNASLVVGESVNDITDTQRVDELLGTAAISGSPVTVEPIPAAG